MPNPFPVTMAGTISIHGDPQLGLPEIEFNFEVYTGKDKQKKLRTCRVTIPERNDDNEDATVLTFPKEDVTIELIKDKVYSIDLRSTKWMLPDDKEIDSTDLSELERHVLTADDPILPLAFNIATFGWALIEDGLTEISDASNFFGKAIKHWKDKDEEGTTEDPDDTAS